MSRDHSNSGAADASLTDLLSAWHRGSAAAKAHVIERVYQALRQRAAVHLRRERHPVSLSPTEIVHEVFLRLAQQNVAWQNRDHFFGIASRMMRRVLVDHARARLALKRAGLRVELTEDIAHVGTKDLDLLALDDAISELGRIDPRQAHLVELRFFAGLSLEEAASVQAISLSTANRDWRFARAWLYRKLTSAGPALRETAG